ncbi:MAG TPA: hypothetical protein DEA08_14450, partial [Planctomycetes bacterium]|nr:hypothetical protein [Planctomycetota bacterium]
MSAPASGYRDLGGVGLVGYAVGPLESRGSTGADFRGRRSADGAEVRIKVLSTRLGGFKDLDALARDLSASTSLFHPNLARTLAVGTCAGQRVAVFERAAGRPLSARVGTPLPWAEACQVVYDLAQVLAAAHGRGVCCGDIRPEKVYYDGQVARLVELGLARAEAWCSGAAAYGIPFGHPGYLAPEVLQDRLHGPTPGTDLYALGFLFYELLTGRRPFPATLPKVLGQHLTLPLPPPPSGVALPVEVSQIVLGLTAKAPRSRLSSAQLLVGRLAPLCEDLSSVPVDQEDEQELQVVTEEQWDLSTSQTSEPAHWSTLQIEQTQIEGPQDLAASDVRNVLEETGRLPAIPDDAMQPAEGPTTAEDPDPLVAESTFQLEEQLGRGRLGNVFAGTFGEADTPAIVTVLSRKFTQHKRVFSRMKAALESSARLRADHIVPVLGTSTQEGRFLVGSAVPPGSSLRELLDEGPLELERALRVMDHLAKALDAAAEAELHHGDLRPENVYIDEQGRAHLARFGYAEGECLGAGHGKLGMRFGHPSYLAPEVAQERLKTPNTATDLYALGILFYEVLTGGLPYPADTPREALKAHLQRRLPRPKLELPRNVLKLLIGLTAKTPSHRYASARAFRRRLRRVRAALLRRSQPAPPPPVATSEELWSSQAAELVEPPAEWSAESLPTTSSAQVEEAIGVEEDDLSSNFLESISASGAGLSELVRPTPVTSRRDVRVTLLLFSLLLAVVFGLGIAHVRRRQHEAEWRAQLQAALELLGRGG